MTNPADQFPDTFDIDGLRDPSPHALSAFDEVCTDLDGISAIDRAAIDEASEVQVCFLDNSFNNGSHITGHSVQGDDEYTEAWGETMSVRSISLKTAEGTTYDFSAYTTKPPRLSVKRPGERVIREVGVGDINVGSGGGVSAVIKGTPEFMRSMASDLAERREADNLGLSKPTDASVKEFTAAIRAALGSGLVSTESH